jgi:hypothetical protein
VNERAPQSTAAPHTLTHSHTHNVTYTKKNKNPLFEKKKITSFKTFLQQSSHSSSSSHCCTAMISSADLLKSLSNPLPLPLSHSHTTTTATAAATATATSTAAAAAAAAAAASTAATNGMNGLKVKRVKKKWKRAYDSDSDSDSDSGSDSDSRGGSDAEVEREVKSARVQKSSNSNHNTASSSPDSSSSSDHSTKTTHIPSIAIATESNCVSYRTQEKCIRSTMTLGDLLRPVSDFCSGGGDVRSPAPSSFFAQAKRDNHENVHVVDYKSDNSMRIPDVVGNDDEWMEDSDFVNVTPVADLQPQVCKKKRGPATGKQSKSNVKLQPEDYSEPKTSLKEKKKQCGALVTARRDIGMINEKDNVDDDIGDDDAHKPNFSGKSFSSSDATSLILTYKEEKRTGDADEGKCNNSSHKSDQCVDKMRGKDISKATKKTTHVPVYTMHFLKDYQVEGVKWLWAKYAKGLGTLIMYNFSAIYALITVLCIM